MEGEPAQATPGVVSKEPNASGPQLTAHERQDLDARSAALKTDPVARGTGGIVMAVVGVALSVGLTIWAVNQSKEDPTTIPSAGMR